LHNDDDVVRSIRGFITTIRAARSECGSSAHNTLAAVACMHYFIIMMLCLDLVVDVNPQEVVDVL
jgi:hypothetical protein